jgi:hypothetical protein
LRRRTEALLRGLQEDIEEAESQEATTTPAGESTAEDPLTARPQFPRRFLGPYRIQSVCCRTRKNPTCENLFIDSDSEPEPPALDPPPVLHRFEDLFGDSDSDSSDSDSSSEASFRPHRAARAHRVIDLISDTSSSEEEEF